MLIIYAIATCKGSILRGSGVDAYGDAVDVDTVVQDGVLACIRETASTVYDQTSQTPRQVRVTTAELQSTTDLRVGDRFRDDTYGVTYWVRNVTTRGGPGLRADLLAELERVT